jgi:hypothetical protein
LNPLVDASSIAAALPSKKKRKSKTEQDQIHDTTERAVFYNIFVPDVGKENALSIVREQLARKKISSLADSAPVYYTLIGNQNATRDIEQICVMLQQKCHLLRYAKEGDEGLTLESLHEYCQEHPRAIVTYIHDKGSFHSSERNDKLRHMLTRSVFSNECQQSQPDTCNICSARFAPLPHFHMAGNMWTAECSYIQNLIPPRQFATQMGELIDFVVAKNDTSHFPRPSNAQIRHQFPVGLERFALEHWSASHPSVKPCDVYPNPRFMGGYTNLPTIREFWKLKLQKASWIPFGPYSEYSSKGDWYCGKARLLEFEFLYGAKPPPDSFIWSYYGAPTKHCPEAIPRSDKSLLQ